MTTFAKCSALSFVDKLREVHIKESLVTVFALKIRYVHGMTVDNFMKRTDSKLLISPFEITVLLKHKTNYIYTYPNI